MKITMQTKGFRELERAIVEELPKATARNVLRRTAMKAMQPVESRMKELAPKDEGDLAESITTKPVKAKRTSRTRYAASDGVTVATGPTGREEGGNAAWQEFGTVNDPAQPYARPAADQEGMTAINEVRETLAAEVGKAKARIARKAAKGR